MDEEPDYYAVLEVAIDASQDDIEEAWDYLKASLHPDREHRKGFEDRATRRFQEAEQAYWVLSDPTRRRNHDAKRGNRERSVGNAVNLQLDPSTVDFGSITASDVRTVTVQVRTLDSSTPPQLTRESGPFWHIRGIETYVTSGSVTCELQIESDVVGLVPQDYTDELIILCGSYAARLSLRVTVVASSDAYVPTLGGTDDADDHAYPTGRHKGRRRTSSVVVIAILVLVVILLRTLSDWGADVEVASPDRLEESQGGSNATVPATTPCDPTVTTSPPASAEYVLGQPWEQERVSLTLTNLEVRSPSHRDDAAFRAFFRVLNKTGQPVVFDVDWSDILILDDLGGRYGDYYDEDNQSVELAAGEAYDFDRYYSQGVEEFSRLPVDSQSVAVDVAQLGPIKNATWRVAAEPTSMPIDRPTSAKEVGQAWEQGGLRVALAEIEIAPPGGSGGSAMSVTIEVANTGSERRLLAIDTGYLYAQDSEGQRFSDYDGGELLGTWLEPEDTYEFTRSYSVAKEVSSRISPSSSFVLFTAEQLPCVGRPQWWLPIVR